MKDICEQKIMGSTLYFRIASFSDAKLLFDWANDQETRRNSLNPTGFTFDSHCRWLKQKLSNNNYHILIYTDGKNDLGLVRLECNEKKAYLSYLIDAKFRGIGLGKKMLYDLELFAFNELTITQINAIVKIENKASIRIFENLNYIKKQELENAIEYIKKLR